LDGRLEKRLLLFGINYAPEQTGAGVVTTSFTEELADVGWDVEVVTGIPHYPSWRPGSVPRDGDTGRIRIHRRRHYVPRTQTASRRAAYELSWLCSALPDVLVRRRPDVVLGIVPSLSGAALAATAAARYRVPYALLFFDLMGRAAEQSGLPGGEGVSRVVKAVELALARRAARIGVVGEGFHDYLLEGGLESEKIGRIVMGGRDRAGDQLDEVERREVVRERLGWPAEVFVILYSGSIGYKQALETVIDAAGLARSDSRMRFVFQGDGNQRAELEARARELKLENVEFRTLVSQAELPSVLAAADVLVLHQRATVRNMAYPSKLASYFESGSPVIAAVSPDDAVAHELTAAGVAVVVAPESPAELLSSIVDLRADPQRARSLAAAARRYSPSGHLDGQVGRFGIDELLTLTARSREVSSAQEAVAASAGNAPEGRVPRV
jgi:colanic acid biosynthesis glycosyl transferase WcaI